tara:strand:- start:690 stop:947 length:258 start_codon:yes stop_codon:yes gene_type:complete
MVPKIPNQIDNFQESLSGGTNLKPTPDDLDMMKKVKKAIIANAYLSQADVAGSRFAGSPPSKPKLRNLPAAHVEPQIITVISSRK